MSDTNEPPRPDGYADEPAPSAPPAPPSAPPAADSPWGAPGAGGAGAYGGPPPPAPPYDGDAGGAYSPTEALSYGWRKFSASPATLLIPMIVVFVGIVVVSLIVEFAIIGAMTGTHTCTTSTFGGQVSAQCGPGFFTQLLAAGLAGALINLVAQLLLAGLYKGATHVTDGKPFGLNQMFEGWNKAQVLYASLFIAVGTFIGTVLCYLPGVIFSFLTMYTLLFVVDKELEAVEAIKASVQLVTKNFVSTLLFYVLAAICLIVGALLCGVGLLVAGPVVLIGLAYTFRRLQGDPVVP
ncbi:hypothetical protein [Nocardioides cynanchi]|uniref:hypothetical protein n=1 Tax=Nocardioides cynanchi TaxID=2558918 RepID=UPI0012483015|nr:hypothetical protein [Nocardioides cynanchi]